MSDWTYRGSWGAPIRREDDFGKFRIGALAGLLDKVGCIRSLLDFLKQRGFTGRSVVSDYTIYVR